MLCYNTVSSCWYAQLCFIFCFCMTLNNIVVPTAEVKLISQRGMDYCCVYHGQLFLPGFILLIEPYSCVPGSINFNEEYLIIMSIITQDGDHQSNDVLISTESTISAPLYPSLSPPLLTLSHFQIEMRTSLL